MAKKIKKKKKKNRALPALIMALLFLALFYVVVFLRGSQPALPADPAESSAPAPAESAAPAQRAAPAEPTPEPTPENPADLRLSELMAKNHSALRAPDGSFPDWIELYNADSEPVLLEGWRLSDKESGGWALPALTLQPGEYLLVYADGSGRMEDGLLCADFSLSPDETVYLFSPGGTLVDQMACGTEVANHSMARDESGELFETKDPTPGLPNTKAGAEIYAASLDPLGPLSINEVVVSNFSTLAQGGKYYDWVELKNISEAALLLSDYYLSDDEDEPLLWRLPELTLEPGQSYVVFCSGDESLSNGSNLHTNFKLDAAEEDLFLSDANGRAVDYVYLRNIPTGGSMGRLPGESGWFYFLSASPNADNGVGYRRVSDKPAALAPDGVYNDVDSVLVELTAPGTIYYSVGSAVPTTSSTVYTEPIPLEKTGIIRAIAVEEGCAPSRVLTLSYILNENHTLPVLSLVTDNAGTFNSIYSNGRKYFKVPASLSFYEESGSFTIACGVSMKGWTSLELPKKSLGVSFGAYGDGDLTYDPFGNGIHRYSSLSIRAGQTYMNSFINNELFQELCAEASDHVLVQDSRYCILYINGEYRGIYCLKEDFSKQYYASHAGVSKGSVENLRSSVSNQSSIYKEVLTFCVQNDMSQPENYQHFCDMFDVDSLIDWLIMEAYCSNSDVNGNMRYFRSLEGDGRWQIAYYDLDWSFRVTVNCFDNVINPQRIVQISPTVKALLKNTDFKMKLAKRCVELCGDVLSNEHVLEKIDAYQALLEPEMVREHQRWGGNINYFRDGLTAMRNFVTSHDWENYMVRKLMSILKLTDAQKAEVMG